MTRAVRVYAASDSNLASTVSKDRFAKPHSTNHSTEWQTASQLVWKAGVVSHPSGQPTSPPVQRFYRRIIGIPIPPKVAPVANSRRGRSCGCDEEKHWWTSCRSPARTRSVPAAFQGAYGPSCGVRSELKLNPGESRHQLARRLFFAKQGAFLSGDYEKIMNKLSALSILRYTPFSNQALSHSTFTR